MNAPPAPRFFYGWVVVAMTSVVLVVTAGARVAPGAFLLDMKADTGWSIAVLSFAAAVGLIVFGLAGPVAESIRRRAGTPAIPAAA